MTAFPTRVTSVMLSNWRIMAMWTEGPEFIVVMGRSRRRCLALLDEALSDYSYEDLKQIDSFWLEVWTLDEVDGERRWLPVEEIRRGGVLTRRWRRDRRAQRATVA